jgi:CheY-like chemotaxis protein/HPt (histidine-containing phosphotransfer) domain-containing protein
MAGATPGRHHDDLPAPARAVQPPGHRILVAEDQPVNYMLVERMLTKRGHETANAADGERAVAMFDAERYDLVLMDCHMPGLDGYAATREIRRREQATGRSRIPIVAMTADAMPGDRERCLAAGMDDYLAKPVTASDIDAVLERWLGEARENTVAPLDAARMHELQQLFPGSEAADMLAALERDVGSQLERITAALQRDDPAAVREAAHRVLNSARMLGAEQLAEAAAAVEAASGDRVIAFRAAARLADRWRPVRDALATPP